MPSLKEFKDSDYLYLSVGIVGATIAPWQQFYLQASVVERGAGPKELKYSQADAIVGSLFSVLVAGFIVIACAATLFTHGFFHIKDAADAAQSLKPLGGEYAFILFSVGLLNASLFAASILPNRTFMLTLANSHAISGCSLSRATLPGRNAARVGDSSSVRARARVFWTSFGSRA